MQGSPQRNNASRGSFAVDIETGTITGIELLDNFKKYSHLLSDSDREALEKIQTTTKSKKSRSKLDLFDGELSQPFNASGSFDSKKLKKEKKPKKEKEGGTTPEHRKIEPGVFNNVDKRKSKKAKEYEDVLTDERPATLSDFRDVSASTSAEKVKKERRHKDEHKTSGEDTDEGEKKKKKEKKEKKLKQEKKISIEEVDTTGTNVDSPLPHKKKHSKPKDDDAVRKIKSEDALKPMSEDELDKKEKKHRRHKDKRESLSRSEGVRRVKRETEDQTHSGGENSPQSKHRSKKTTLSPSTPETPPKPVIEIKITHSDSVTSTETTQSDKERKNSQDTDTHTDSRRPSIENNMDDEEEKRERIRSKIIDEVIHTERDYANDLGAMVKVNRYFKMKLKDSTIWFLWKRIPKLVSKDDVQHLFSNLKELLDITYSVLNTMEQRKRKKENGGKYVIGDVFFKLAEDFRAYTIYCINHPIAVNTLERLRLESPAWTQWEKETEALAELRGIGLIGFLIKPVQRICKYPLLLKELLRQTPESHPEYQKISAALDKTEQVVDYVNQRKKIVENEMKLNDIRKLIDGLGGFELVKPTRFFIAEILVNKVYHDKKDAEAPYKLFLFNDHVMLTKIKKERLKYKHRIYLDRVRFIDSIDNQYTQNMFDIEDRMDDKAKFQFCAESDKVKKFFLNDIKAAQKEYYLEHEDQLKAEAKAREYLQAFQFKNAKGVQRGNSHTDINTMYQNMNNLSLNKSAPARASSVTDLKSIYKKE